MSIVNPDTGEVVEAPGADVDLVTLDLAGLNEEALLAMFPTPIQAAGALLKARAVARRAPQALKKYRGELLKAERDLKVALGMAIRDLRDEYPKATVTELRDIAHGTSGRVRDAQDARDTAWLMLEYARDFDRAIGRDIDILRSLNANFRGEH
ncbi:MAG TPA: hypothetical protein VN133_13690 [Humibacter sp.]|nr:hypothetical protein [Humibacter sp.]